MSYKNIAGRRFGRLVAQKMVGRVGNWNINWECKCNCGNTVVIKSNRLLAGDKNSCGCLAMENRTTHGMNGKRPSRIWKNMKQRVSNPKAINYQNYGGRGVTVCDKWLTFGGFWEDMEEGYTETLTLDRIDSSKGYSKDNCRWATMTDQQNNRRNNVRLKADGRDLTTAEWVRELGIKRDKIRAALRNGFTMQEIYDKYAVSSTSPTGQHPNN